MVKLITSARFIGETIDDLDLSTSDYIDRFYSWIEYGLGIMGLSKYYTLQSKVVEIDNFKGMLPCDAKFVHSVWTQGSNGYQNGGSYGMGYVSASTSPLVGRDFKDYPVSNRLITIDGYHVHSDVKKTKVLIIYRGIPRDCDGYPMVPDNPFVFEALMYYIVFRLAMRGVAHPVISFEMAKQLWEQMYPRAANDVNWMDHSEYEEFTSFWNSPYIGNIVEQLYTS